MGHLVGACGGNLSTKISEAGTGRQIDGPPLTIAAHP